MRFLFALFLFVPAIAAAQSADWKKPVMPLADDTPMYDRYVYFNESTVGKNVPVNLPVLITPDITEFLSQRVAEVMTLDGRTYDQKIIQNRRYFTDTGYKQYVTGLESAQVPVLLKQRGFSMSGVVLQPPEITAQGLRSDAPGAEYVWQLRVPVTLVYQNIDGSSDYRVTLRAELVRVPMQPDGTLVAINSWQFTAK